MALEAEECAMVAEGESDEPTTTSSCYSDTHSPEPTEAHTHTGRRGEGAITEEEEEKNSSCGTESIFEISP